MPIFEYRCPDCGSETSLEHHISEDRKKQICPDCKGLLSPLVSLCTFRLAGSGWASDGYQLDSEKAHDDPGIGEVTGVDPDMLIDLD
ncbi:MAG: zinc ribbon domain-containing protein [Anaerolineae bacterium]|nr:zinc ribbon domain-containing protein [Anaerolineae bacterium]